MKAHQARTSVLVTVNTERLETSGMNEKSKSKVHRRKEKTSHISTAGNGKESALYITGNAPKIEVKNTELQQSQHYCDFRTISSFMPG